jgi:GNAT superfamily N-acetyltransferase
MPDFKPYSLSDFSPEYQEELLKFLDQGYKDLGYTCIEPEGLDDDLLQIPQKYLSPSCFQILLDGQKIIGSVAVKIYPNEKRAELKRVFVDKNYQGQGLGIKLSEWAFDFAKDQACLTMDIWSGTLCHGAHKLYKKLGAIDMNQIRSIGGIDDVQEFYFVKTLET